MEPRRGFSGRLLIAFIIAAIGFYTYYSQVQENPVTHQKQHVTFSPEQEMRLGLESAPVMARQMGGELPETDPRTQEVQRIGQFIVSKSLVQKSPWRFKFHLLQDTKTINAFALPGGQIFITLGLYDKLQNEAQLAGVLSHEIGHVIERHSAEQMAKSQLGQSLVTAVATGVSDPSHPGSMYSTAMIASVVNQMFQLRYSRHDELEADIWGLKLMVDSGFNPMAMVEVMKILKSASGGSRGIDFFQTHPNPDLRVEQIEEYLKQNPPKENLSNGQPLPH